MERLGQAVEEVPDKRLGEDETAVEGLLINGFTASAGMYVEVNVPVLVVIEEEFVQIPEKCIFEPRPADGIFGAILSSKITRNVGTGTKSQVEQQLTLFRTSEITRPFVSLEKYLL